MFTSPSFDLTASVSKIVLDPSSILMQCSMKLLIPFLSKDDKTGPLLIRYSFKMVEITLLPSLIVPIRFSMNYYVKYWGNYIIKKKQHGYLQVP